MHPNGDLRIACPVPTPEQLSGIISALTEVVRSNGVINAELWREADPPQERPGRLELPKTETIFVRIERVLPV